MAHAILEAARFWKLTVTLNRLDEAVAAVLQATGPHLANPEKSLGWKVIVTTS